MVGKDTEDTNEHHDQNVAGQDFMPYYPVYGIPYTHSGHYEPKPEITKQDFIILQQQMNQQFYVLNRNLDLLHKEMEHMSSKISDLQTQVRAKEEVKRPEWRSPFDSGFMTARPKPKQNSSNPFSKYRPKAPPRATPPENDPNDGPEINMIIHTEDMKPGQEVNPFSLLSHIFNVDGAGDKKSIFTGNPKNKKPTEEVEEESEESEVSEYDSNDECEEIETTIESVSDLIELGDMVDRLSAGKMKKSKSDLASSKKDIVQEDEPDEENESSSEDDDDDDDNDNEDDGEESNTQHKNKDQKDSGQSKQVYEKKQEKTESTKNSSDGRNNTKKNSRAEMRRAADLIKVLENMDSTTLNALKLDNLCEQIEERQSKISSSDPENLLTDMLDMVEKTLAENPSVSKRRKSRPSRKTKKSTPKKKRQNRSLFEVGGKKYSVDLQKVKNLQKPLTKLNSMVGLKDLKQSVVDMILYYLQGFENHNSNLLHTVIEGPPGVGKTQLGKILAQIYAGLGIIKSPKVKFVRRTDLVGEYLGHTAQKTQRAIDEAEGGVLFIDEAYALGNEEKRDSFAKECIDTINQNLSENKKKFICIIAGYPKELEKCFFSYNPGLRRRFPFKFTIDGYEPDELRDIFVIKVREKRWKLDQCDLDMDHLTKFFRDNKDQFPYYGGDIENLFTLCKFMHSRRLFGKHPKYRRKLIWEDLKKGFDAFVELKKNKEDTISMERLASMYI